ncbi:hypothetical protein BDV41DRAFT_527434 [Aspergillus transmontanensis]|uniref:Uncharacterized protein n=1 Tax=Aspergillus transmontanensis TaxID=1034304 RepID=A0A5N6W837_9EURO|nr:hypothetical protein BDV41DRAFT_527434 [Aspergillus transmontanensis]
MRTPEYIHIGFHTEAGGRFPSLNTESFDHGTTYNVKGVATVSFLYAPKTTCSVNEASAKLIYGSYLEDQFSIIQVQHSMGVMHTVTFLIADSSLINIVAMIGFSKDLGEATTPHAIHGLHALPYRLKPVVLRLPLGFPCH